MTNPKVGGLTIRPSMTSGYPDCNLRGLAKAYPGLFADLGYRLRETSQSIAASVGTGVHAGAAMTLKRKMGTGNLGTDDEATAAAIDALRKDMEGSSDIITDDLTPTVNVAEQQAARMLKCYRVHFANTVNPLAVETRFQADAGDGFTLSGQADLVAMEPGGIDDLKTGAVERVHIAQLGTYSLVYQPHGYRVDWLRQTFIPRVRLSAAQPEPSQVYYDPAMAEQIATARIRQIKRDVNELVENGPLVIQANPASMLCSDRWCPAWGTKACRQHKGAK
jgi:hypothetical protein